VKTESEIRKNISKVMEVFYGEVKTVEEAKEVLHPLLNDFVYLYENHYVESEGDWRSGEEVYGYKDEESILGNLKYISDRWGAACRLRWMIDLLDPDYSFKGKEQ